jgi:hypothetical protein
VTIRVARQTRTPPRVGDAKEAGSREPSCTGFRATAGGLRLANTVGAPGSSRGISTRLRSRRDCSKASVPARALPLHWAVPFYRSKFTDWLAGAVPNSYPNVDLLWDSVIAGPWGWLRSTVQARVLARRLLPLSAGRGRSICQPGEFSIEKCNPALVS